VPGGDIARIADRRSSVARSVRPADGSAGLADGGSGHAAASDHGPTRAATGGYLRDHAVRLRNWGGRHCLRRSCDGEGKASNGNQPEHWFSPFFLDVLPVWFRGLASLSANVPAGSTASGSSQAFTIHHVHTGAACFADGND
jgi:hypothetical protein